MSELLQKFSLQTAKFSMPVVLLAIFVWLAVMACVISSLSEQPFTQRQRIFWICLIVLVPIFGVLAYLPFSFRSEESQQLFMKRPRKKPQISVERLDKPRNRE